MNHAPPLAPTAQRRAAGAALRAATPRSAHADWQPPVARRDPVQTIIDQGATRIPELLPLRYARMQPNAFAFLRGAAAIMAADLAHTPAAGPRVQACGDCHLANFGAYRSPEGAAVFDVNDFDETLPAPFEWDLKRLATSLVVSGQGQDLSAKACRELARSAVAAYRTHMAELAALSPIDAWRSRIAVHDAIAAIDNAKLRAKETAKLRASTGAGNRAYGLAERTQDGWRIPEKPGLRRLTSQDLRVRRMFHRYGTTLSPERRALFERYALQDIVFKAVGVGSVGTFCAIGLFTTADGEPLLLQLKQADHSVLAPFAGASTIAHQGQRVVLGQRFMQATADIFLGWTEAEEGDVERQVYVRELKDPKLAAIGTDFSGSLPFYAMLCGRTLARAHARSGDAALISGYLGSGDAMDDAVAEFAIAYAAQNHADWQAMLAAIASGRISASSA